MRSSTLKSPQDTRTLAALSTRDCHGPRAADGGDERRRHGRIRTELLTCEHGEVVNLSVGGMKLKTHGEPQIRSGDELDVTLKSLSPDLTVPTKVIWTHHVGDGRYEIGMSFADADPKTLSALQQTAKVSQKARMVSDR